MYKAYLTATEKPSDGKPPEAGSGQKRDAPGAAAASAADAPVPKKKKSRWGAKATPAAADPNGAGATTPGVNAAAAPTRGRSRWGDKAVPSAPAGQTVALPGGGTLSLTPVQSAAYLKLQMSLRDIQTKITNIAIDVKRVESLPKGHPDRR